MFYSAKSMKLSALADIPSEPKNSKYQRKSQECHQQYSRDVKRVRTI